jgi:hypothetical protein
MSDDSTTDHRYEEDADSTRSASDHLVQEETKAVNFPMLVYKILLITGAALGVICIFFCRRERRLKTRYVVFATIVHAVHWPNKYAFSNTMNSYHVQFNFF